jgi:hypothetical protein
MTIPDAEAVERARCPRCRQPKGEPCIHQMPRAVRYADTPRPPSMREKVERVGTPTKHVHPERREVVRKLRIGEQPGSTGAAARNELRVLEKLADGELHVEDEFYVEGERLGEAFARCRDAAWIENGAYSWNYRITETGRMRLEGTI